MTPIFLKKKLKPKTTQLANGRLESELNAPALATRVSLLPCGTRHGGRRNQSVLTDTFLESQVLGRQVSNLPDPSHLAAFRLLTEASTSPGEAPLPGNPRTAHGS